MDHCYSYLLRLLNVQTDQWLNHKLLSFSNFEIVKYTGKQNKNDQVIFRYKYYVIFASDFFEKIKYYRHNWSSPCIFPKSCFFSPEIIYQLNLMYFHSHTCFILSLCMQNPLMRHGIALLIVKLYINGNLPYCIWPSIACSFCLTLCFWCWTLLIYKIHVSLGSYFIAV